MRARFITPALTLLKYDGTPDKAKNSELLNRLAGEGVDAIAVLGSSGEFCHFSADEKKEVLETAAEAVGGKTKLIAGTGAMTVEETLEMADYAGRLGFSDILLVCPYYFKVSDESLFAYYDAIATQVKSNIYIYNYPDRTGNDISPKITQRLVKKHSNIVGYKDTVASVSHTRELIKSMSEFPNFEIYAGFEDNFTATVLSGGAGCVGGLSNIDSKPLLELREALKSNDLERVAKAQQEIDVLVKFYDISVPFIPAAKYALMLMGQADSEKCAFPIAELSTEQKKMVRKFVEDRKL